MIARANAQLLKIRYVRWKDSDTTGKFEGNVTENL